jgi:hypothetical protein
MTREAGTGDPTTTALVARGRAPSLVFALQIAPPEVVPRLLARPGVQEGHDGDAKPGEDGYDLQRTPTGFTLTADPGGPGAWRPGSQAICEGELVPIAGGTRLVVRFRLHPLTRGAFAFLAVIGLAMVGFQLIVAGPTTAAVLLVPILVVTAILAADRSRLRRQQMALRSLIESTFTPVAQPRDAPPDDPFRVLAPPGRRG